MSNKKKTNKEFLDEVFVLVGNEYTFLEEYKLSSIPIKVKHNNCGREYKVSPNNFLKGRRCSKCVKRYKPTIISNEEFLEKVNSIYKDEYTLLEEYKGSFEPIKARHNVCGSVFNIIPGNFLRRKKCPHCNSRKFSNKEFLDRVKALTKDEYTFLEEYKNYKAPLKIRHNFCGNIYKVSPSNFLFSGRRCPFCQKQKSRKKSEDFIREVYDLVKDEYTFLETYTLNNKKIKVRHNNCGLIYKVSPNKFLQGRRCPNCSLSKGESKIEDWLKDNRISYKSEYTFNDLVYINKLRYDFAILDKDEEVRMLIEYDGKQHYEAVDFFGGEKALKELQFRDELKNKYAYDNKIPLYRIKYTDFDNIENILDKIFKKHKEE